MFVRDYMALDPVIVAPEDTLGRALELMKKHSIRRLPVMSKGKLVGLVTENDLMRAYPSSATSLSVWEVNYLFPKIKIKDIMTREIYTVTPDTILEEAALIMQEKHISTLPVLENNRLVGIITESDLFKAFIDVLGLNHPSVRVTLAVQDQVGVLKNVAAVVGEAGFNIISTIVQRPSRDRVYIILRLDTNDLDGVARVFAEAGIEVAHIC
ncbi:MAG TPA: CBS domain-containing protein [Bacillota bacterium]|jgi:acetoin utilization protein AcuB|nr:CBS domain-containing protein [Bacillota bacterium]